MTTFLPISPLSLSFLNNFLPTFVFRKCQAIAAVALNNPNSVEKVDRTADTRFIMLNDRTVDVLAGGDTYTIEREVDEVRHEIMLVILL